MRNAASKKAFTLAASMRRGDEIARGGNIGRFVGVDKSGVIWIAWEVEAFERMCKAFDALR